MKKVLASVLCFAVMLSCAVSVGAESGGGDFVVKKIPFPSEIRDNDSWQTYARYKDTKEAVTLSQSYNGYVFATVPKEFSDREIEAFVPEEVTFSDIGENEVTNYFDIKQLAETGVIKGNEKGEAEPERSVTRAEAVSMIMRFMGLDSDPVANMAINFSDVSKNDWFYAPVMSAYRRGIVEGDSEVSFSPERDITHEELILMIARALKLADLRCPSSGEAAYDIDDVSDWAKEAYEILGAACVYDYIENKDDAENPYYILAPKKVATRNYTANLLNNVQRVCQNYPSDLAVEFGFDENMPVIDGSTSTYPFTEAVYSSLFSNGRNHKMFPKKHSKSHASYERLINGEVDMIFASVYPASDILKLAEEKGVELELIPIAYDAMIFFTNAENPAEGLTTEQITDIYVNDAYENWSELGGEDALLYPYCRNNDSGSHAQMEKHFLKGKDIHPEVKKETSYTMSNVLTDVMGAKTQDPRGFGLGYSIYYYFKNMDVFYDTSKELKILKINGIMPNDETIASGEYPLSNNTYVVLRKDSAPDSPERKMAEFMLTEAGQACVENAGFGRLMP